jgi:protein-L-isoaspartate(D-aspartate) O-methyltransferase
MAHKALAFVDMEIPLKDASQQGQVMLAPRVEARFLQNAAVQSTDKVLEIGTGSGYMAALLAHQAASVISFELDPALALQARVNLQAAGVHNVEVRQADGCQGAPAEGPFDVIMLSGSVPDVPQVLLNQLSIGGRLLAVVGEDPVMRASVITRTADQQWQTSEPWDTVAPRLQGFPEHNRFSF